MPFGWTGHATVFASWPRNPIGWLMLAGPGLALLSIGGTVYAELTYRPGYHLPFGVVGILLDAS